jgi:hypothetical protein
MMMPSHWPDKVGHRGGGGGRDATGSTVITMTVVDMLTTGNVTENNVEKEEEEMEINRMAHR